MSSLPPNSLPSSIGVSIKNEEDFTSFASEMNEQRISPQGRMMSPIPLFEFTGLDPNAFYKLNLRFDRILNVKYRFEGNNFVDSGVRLFTPSSSATVDYYQKPQIGKIFMDFGAKFDLLMSNKRDGVPEQAVYLESLCKYQTVLIVTKVAEGRTLDDFIAIEPPKEFTFECLQFITVTQYHKESVKQLKTSLHAANAGKMKAQMKKKERKNPISIPNKPSPKAPHWYPSIGDGQVKYSTYTWTMDHFRIETPIDPTCSIFDDYNLSQTSNSSQPVLQNGQNSLVTPPARTTPSTSSIHTFGNSSAFANMYQTLRNVPVPTTMNNPAGMFIPNQNTWMNSHRMNSMNPDPYGSMNIPIPNFLNTPMQPNLMDPRMNNQMPIPNQSFNGNNQQQYPMNPVQQWPQYFMQPPTHPVLPGYPGHQFNPPNYYPYNN